MKKKIIFLAILFFGILFAVSAEDQIFFDLTYGVNFYPAIGGKIGWMHYWNNEKIGLVTDISYYNNGFVEEPEGDWREESKKAHNIGIAAGVVFNNMGMNSVIRTMEYIKLKGILHLWNETKFYPWLDLGFKLNVFFTNTTALSVGIGADLTWLAFPHIYASLGAVFTLK
jgi:hypothetical protein